MPRFEVHFTVDASVGVAREAGFPLGLRVSHVALAKGATPDHVMLTERFVAPSPDDALGHVARLAAGLTARARVVRTKLELDLDGGACDVVGIYGESHVKVAASDEAELAMVAAAFGAHPSRTIGPTGSRFLTLRGAVGVGSVAPESLVDGLRHAGFLVLAVHRELVILDTNLGLDAGWLPEART